MSLGEKKLTIHMIGHGHIDPTWLWRWTEGFEEVRATFKSALDRMEEDEQFIFTASSACFYEWVKENDGELFEKIRERVNQGRWELAGGLWVEPDCNIPCGESFVRHGLYSQRFFQREFGKKCCVGFNPDSFGHAGTLPQLLKKMGIEYYVYMRPDPDWEMDYPDGTLFRWVAMDGSSVLASHIPLGYDASSDRVQTKIERLSKYPYLSAGQAHLLCLYGVGNHGGGPTRETISVIHSLVFKEPPASADVQFSSLERFFGDVEESMPGDNLPEIKNELQYHARGCYSVHSEIKALNRQVENALMNAERFATAAWLMDLRPYPHDVFEKCWKDVMYNQFHDILAGTSIESSYRDSRDQFGAARHRADVQMNAAVQGISRSIDTSSDGNTIIAFNPLPWPVTAPLMAPPSVERYLVKPVHIVNNDSHVVCSQPIRGERIDHTRHRFVAQVPAMGYSVFHVRSGCASCKQALPLECGSYFLENSWWRLEFDVHSGELTRLYDKTHKVELLKRGHILAAMVDHSDTWSHGVEEYQVEAGRFSNAELAMVEHGDVQSTLRTVARHGKSTAITEYTLFREIDHIACELRINWQEHYQALKLGFDTNIVDGRATYDVPYGYQERVADGREQPGQQWFDLTGSVQGKSYGLAIINDGKYGFDVRDGQMRMTLLRSPAYAHHDNGRFEAREYWPIIDQGWQRIKLSLIPHVGDWREAHVVKRAWELNAPAFVHPESSHPGNHAFQEGLLGTESDNVLISAVKCSEEGNDIIVRGYETAGRCAETRLHLPYFNKSFDVKFAPHEIKTLRINKDVWTIREVNLLEE